MSIWKWDRVASEWERSLWSFGNKEIKLIWFKVVNIKKACREDTWKREVKSARLGSECQLLNDDIKNLGVRIEEEVTIAWRYP